jgi:hypothetical protein
MASKIFITLLFISFFTSAQTHNKDSLVKVLLNDNSTPDSDQGLQLVQSGDFNGANQYFSNEINKDESDRKAYFRRGVANWALSDTLSACRDWSAVLALGDTEMFNILDGHCHGEMIIENDRIPSKQYHKLFAQKDDAKKDAKTVVEVMPSFSGGDQKMFEYISKNLKHPSGNSHGTVYVNFLIDPKGKILFPYVTHGVDATCNKEALRLIRTMPAWNPGKQGGKPQYVRSNLPIRF